MEVRLLFQPKMSGIHSPLQGDLAVSIHSVGLNRHLGVGVIVGTTKVTAALITSTILPVNLEVRVL